MRKLVALVLILTVLGILSGIASAANGTIWPTVATPSSGRAVR